MIAGIGPATSGEIFLDGKDICNVPPGKRGIAMVFQNYALYPTMTVRENIEFGLKNNKVPKEERNRLIADVSEVVGLSAYLDRKPSTLSGGQRQRVALARAMVKKPKVFLMDEPLSNLDAKLRVAMRVELIELHKHLQTTFVYVTHDQVEAMAMADTIILMDQGEIQQQGTLKKSTTTQTMYLRLSLLEHPHECSALNKDGIQIGFRPEKVVLTYEPYKGTYQRKGVIITREMLGSETLYKVDLGHESVMVKSVDETFRRGEQVYVSVRQADLCFFDRNGLRMRNVRSDDFGQYLAAGGTN